MMYRKIKMGLFSIFRYYAQKNVIFIYGCQRSGTNMLQKIIAKNANFSVYGEDNPKAMEKYRFKDKNTIRKLIKKDPHRYIMFRPLNDIQYADQILDFWPDSKAIWIFRHYSDVINSAVSKWGDTQKRIVSWIKGRKNHLSLEDDGMSGNSTYLERMAHNTFKNIKNLAYDNISEEDGAALIWYMRNSIYFDLNLGNDKRIILIKYEDLVNYPKYHGKKIFNFIGCPIHDDYWNGIFTSSIRKNPLPRLDKQIEVNCQILLQKLNNVYKKQFDTIQDLSN